MQNGPHQIVLENVDVSFPEKRRHFWQKRKRCTVLNGLNLCVSTGEFVTIVGPSGCGKSTLLSMVLGSHFPDAGRVSVDGKRVRRVTRDCGIVYQDYSLFPWLSVMDNITLGPMLDQLSITQRVFLWITRGFFHTLKSSRVRAQAREEARELLKRIGLSESDGDKKPHELSGGMKQRVAIAQALMTKPKVLVMDEPFGALDPGTRLDIQVLLKEFWAKEKMTVLFVTHDIEEAVWLGTRVIALSQYWKDASGRQPGGATIVLNLKIPGEHPKPTGFKNSPEFNQLQETIRNAAMKPTHRQRISQFNLKHEDALGPGEQDGVRKEAAV